MSDSHDPTRVHEAGPRGKLVSMTPSVAPVPRTRADDATLAARRRCVIEVAKGLRPPASVRRVGPQAASAFREFAAEGLPLIIEGVVGNWNISAFEPSDLKTTFGALRVSPRFGDEVADLTQQGMSLAEYVGLVEQGKPGPPPYVGDHPLPMPGLCDWPEYFERWHTPGLWLGPAGTVTRLHCDYEDNLFAQVWGSKRFTLYSPACADLLSLEEFSPLLWVSPFDPEQPDYGRFPRARAAVGIECVVRSNDLLYLPAGWFHHVRALEFSLSVNRWSAGDPAIMTSSKGQTSIA